VIGSLAGATAAISAAAAPVIASARTDVADYLLALIRVYSLLILAYVVTSFLFAVGVKIPYSRGSNAVLNFLRDVSEPYLRIFRRFIPPIGMMDISPIVALIVLQVAGQLVADAIHG
jgi:uncharacterized protein YggT (Ycf19 family)